MSCEMVVVRKKMRKVSYLLFLLTIYYSLSTISCCHAANDGGMPGYFLNQGIGVRSLAMGRAYVSAADDVSALYWNPAMLTRLEKKEITAGHLTLFESTRYDFLGYAGYLGRNIFWGLGSMQLAVDDIKKRDSFNNPIGETKDCHNAYFLSFGQKLKDNILYGLATKAIHKKFDDMEAWGYGVDVSGLYSLYNRKLSLGLNIQNIIRPKLKKNAGEYYVPLNIKAGISLKLGKSCLLSSDLNKTSHCSLKWHSGVEWKMKPLSLRIGYDDKNLVGGFGVNFKNYRFDYALFNHDLGYSHRGAITCAF